MAGEKNEAASIIYYKNIGNQLSKMSKKRLLALEICGNKKLSYKLDGHTDYCICQFSVITLVVF